MFEGIKKLFTQNPSSTDKVHTEPSQGVAEHTAPGSDNYSSDLPIASRSEDRFNRWQFAERIADTLAIRNDPSSLVVGLYGPWGDGKTSTLQLMVDALTAHPQVVVVRFNPWYFQSEEKLLKGFFGTLAEALGASLPNFKETIGTILNKYGSILSLASLSIGGFVTIKANEAAKGLGETLSTVELDDLRRRLEEILEKSGKKVVVLIDDIDRLDRLETHALLKLVKLSAGFKHTRYVLSFDDEMVAAAIGERYGHGNYEAGRSFLEKIVQVPLHLPPADTLALRRMTLEGVQAVLDHSEIALSQGQADAYGRHFVDGLEFGLDTPRRGKVYVNALAFSLPLTKGEVNPVDLMLIEGIRVFYPNLYAEIRDNEDLFLKVRAENAQGNEARRQQLSEVVTRGLGGRNEREIGAIRRGLLDVLFPRISNMGYGHDWDRKWAQEQRICSDQYFKRYFSYGVPPGDIADLEVVRLLERLAGMATDEQNAVLDSYAQRNAYPQFIRKLREREDRIDPPAARALAVALARNGHLPPKERGSLFVTTSMQTGILVAHLLKRVPAGQEREQLAQLAIREAEPLTFGFECIKWMSHSTDRPEADRIVSAECEALVKATLSDRIQARALQEPLYLTFGQGTHALYWTWNAHVGGTAVGDHLRARFAQNPNEVDAFLDTFVGESWGVENGLPRRSDFMRDSYDAIVQLLDPEVIVANLRDRYGADIDTAQFHHDDDVQLARRIALQFAFIHRNVIAERTQVSQAEAGPAPEGQ
jgi:hypothetical protein